MTVPSRGLQPAGATGSWLPVPTNITECESSSLLLALLLSQLCDGW